MKKNNFIIKNFFNLICSFLIALAPIMLERTNCVYLWGEPECPEDLIDLYSND